MPAWTPEEEQLICDMSISVKRLAMQMDYRHSEVAINVRRGFLRKTGRINEKLKCGRPETHNFTKADDEALLACPYGGMPKLAQELGRELRPCMNRRKYLIYSKDFVPAYRREIVPYQKPKAAPRPPTSSVFARPAFFENENIESLARGKK